jgi:cytochrome c oxidase cbb3-type subunit 3
VRSPANPLFRALLSSALLTVACDKAPSDLREWKPDDHDHTDEQQKGRAVPAGVKAKPQPQASASASPLVTLVEVTWRNQCAPCHGMLGHGDGPQGPMVHAPNLTLADWQAKVSDQQIAQVILSGKNRMPKFDFPPDVMAGLVARIRASKGL